MIIDKPLASWAEFRDAVQEIRTKYGFHELDLPEGKNLKRRNVVLFRGQANASWPLATTLERKTSRRCDVGAYMALANSCVDEVTSITGRSWKVPTHPVMIDEIKNNQDFMRLHLPAYDYLVYLRHHGFPSPLLDWTESPYVAAFFAFWRASGADSVAVHAFVETVNGIRGGFEGAPLVHVKGPHVVTDRRHFAQKAWYTVAAEWDREKERHYFCPHDKVFRGSDPNQDLLIRITIPISDRREALSELRDYNIDPFTLFQSEDSLVQAMEMKQFDLGDYS